MSSRRHTGTAIAWGTEVPASASSRIAIIRLPHWTGPAELPEDGKYKPLPGVPSTLSALDLVQKEQAVYCAFPGCGPFVTIAQGTKRAAFRHPQGKSLKEHDSNPETLDHSESKAILLAWILRTYAVARFDRDTTNLDLTDSNGVRVQVRPDAYVELADGGKIAIEYQYSAGSGQEIREKTERYKRAGITVWWIFSGRSPYTLHLRPPVTLRHGGRGYAETDLSTTQIEMLHADIPFLWFDREHQTIATPAGCTARLITPRPDELWPLEDAEYVARRKRTPQTKRKYWGPPIKGFSTRACLVPSALSECDIDTSTGKLTTGGMRKWALWEARAEVEVEQLREEARARHRAAEQHRREMDELAEREARVLSARVKESKQNAEVEATQARRIAESNLAGTASDTTVEKNPHQTDAAQMQELATSSAAPAPMAEEAPPSGEGRLTAQSTEPAILDSERTGGTGLRGFLQRFLDAFR